MILDEQDVIERFESPANLLNRLRSQLSHVTKPGALASIPTMPPTAEDVIDDLQEKLRFGGLKSKAAAVMNQALDNLSQRIPEMQRGRDLADVVDKMGRIVNSENKNRETENDASKPQIIIYAPSFVKEEHYQVIDADE